MSDVLQLKIISPSAIVLDTHVAQVEIPGTEGDFGVLPHHAPFFSMIRPGVISVYFQDGFVRRYFAAAGYADVSTEGCTILSDHLQEMTEIQKKDADDALHAAREALTNAETDAEKHAAQKLVATAEALVLAVAA